MNLDKFPLSAFEVDCDGSACGSPGVQRHLHAPQDGRLALGRVIVRQGERIAYGRAEGITRLVMAGSPGPA